MKKNYVSPMMVGERFVAEEYVAACGDSGKVYNFVCDAEGGILYYYPKSDGKIDGIYTGSGKAERIGGFFDTYTPCSAEHSANSTDSFYDGFVDRNRNQKCDPGENVIVWRGPNNDNGHATTNLDMETWETAKS